MTLGGILQPRSAARVGLLIGLSLALALAGLTVTSAPAAAALSWAEQAITPPGVRNGSVNGTSCPASNFCVGVGTFTDSKGKSRTFSMTWNGVSWTFRTTPQAAGAISSRLNSVSCTEPTFCHAVGGFTTNAGTTKALSMTWNGSGWTLRTTPNPSGSTGTFVRSVVCVLTSNTCTAAGYYGPPTGAYRPMSMTWNGSAWTLRTTPNPAGSTGAFLEGLACRSASHCLAVGYYDTGPEIRPISMTWNGSAWLSRTTPRPSGATDTYLNAVSCASVNSCTAVGRVRTTGFFRALSMTWNGSAWMLRTTPTPGTSTGMVLSGVSCPTTSSCMAVGNYSTASVGTRPASMTWDGSAWTNRTTPTTGNAVGTFLTGVACTAVDECTTGGFITTAGPRLTRAMRWSGSAWTIQTTPNALGTGGSTLRGVSCASATACTAVGDYNTVNGWRALAMTWNASAWSVLNTTAPPGTTRSALAGVSCVSPTVCMAVGWYRTTGDYLPLAMSRSGSTWSLEPVPMPEDATSALLRGVSCTALAECTAVGEYDLGSETLMLALTWDGNEWSLADTPTIPGEGLASEVFYGVSCSSATTCLAVGSWTEASTGFRPLVASRSGTTWTWHLVPGGDKGYLKGVSCYSTTSCRMVGTRSGGTTLAYRWMSGGYATHTTPNPSPSSNFPDGLSCTSNVACAGVGHYGSSDGTKGFAMQWDGEVWTLSYPPPTTLPTSTGVDRVETVAVSCTSATACTAVGTQRRGVDVPYVARSGS